jgi:hypothetical protein
VKYVDDDIIQNLGIYFYSGQNNYPKRVVLDNMTWQLILEGEHFPVNFGRVTDYFQIPEVMTMLYNFVREPQVKNEIVRKNPFASKYGNNHDIFIHIRLDDVEMYRQPVENYMACIDNIFHLHRNSVMPFPNNIHIATDSPDHPYIQKIRDTYANIVNVATVIFDEITTIQFGSTHQHVILSHGSFSGIIGYLSYDSVVYYPKKRAIWAEQFFDHFNMPNLVPYGE